MTGGGGGGGGVHQLQTFSAEPLTFFAKVAPDAFLWDSLRT